MVNIFVEKGKRVMYKWCSTRKISLSQLTKLDGVSEPNGPPSESFERSPASQMRQNMIENLNLWIKSVVGDKPALNLIKGVR